MISISACLDLTLTGPRAVPSPFWTMDNPLMWRHRWRKTIISPFVTRVGIVYGVRSGHVRQHVYSETFDSEYDVFAANLQHNEAMCFVPMTAHHAGHAAFRAAIRAAVLAHGGVPAVIDPNEPGARIFAIVDRASGVVVSLAMADPEIAGDAAVIARDNWIEFPCTSGVGVGWIYSPATGEFLNPAPAMAWKAAA